MNSIFITVRTGSRRFPEKCLKYVTSTWRLFDGSKMAIELVIERAQRSKKAENIILCTTTLPEDDVLEEIAIKRGVYCFRGSSPDKLMRWLGACERFGTHFFVTFDGEDLLCDPELADLAFEQNERSPVDFITAPFVPTGAFTHGISRQALEIACLTKDAEDTENIYKFFDCDVVELENVPIEVQRDFRMTMDYPDDLKFFDKLYDGFDDRKFSLLDAIKYLDRHPEIVLINKHCQDLYLANQKGV